MQKITHSGQSDHRNAMNMDKVRECDPDSRTGNKNNASFNLYPVMAP